MLSPGHAMSGVTVWLGLWATGQQLGLADPRPPELIIGSVVTAGAACLPDLDHRHARITHSLGPVTRLLGWLLIKLGIVIHAVTRTKADKPDRDGHRTISHTFVFAALVGWLVSLAGARWGAYTSAALVWLLGNVGLDAVLSLKWLKSARRPRALGRLPLDLLVPIAAAAFAYFYVPGTSWWLGAAVAVGCATHCLGDMITDGGCPLWWPIPLPSRKGWKIWKAVGPPHFMRFRVGGWVETCVSFLLTAGAAYSGYLLAAA